MARARKSMTIHFDAGTLGKNLEEFMPKLNTFVAQTMEYYATLGEAEMRKNARWRDRTGNARSGLVTSTNSTENHHEMILAHSVSYGIWLEVRFAGRYAIIKPTINKLNPRIMQTLSKGLDRL